MRIWSQAELVDLGSKVNEADLHVINYSHLRVVGDAVAATTFFDDNLLPDMGSAPPDARTPLAGAGNYPGASGFYEQRQVYGGSTNSPDTSYYTRTGNFDSFSVSAPIQADDASAFRTPRVIREVSRLGSAPAVGRFAFTHAALHLAVVVVKAGGTGCVSHAVLRMVVR